MSVGGCCSSCRSSLGVTILVFFLIHLVPGDPARTILGNQATPARVALVRHEFGLDKPLLVQYQKFMGRLVRGDLGSSLFYSVPAGQLVLERLPVTLWLIGLGTLLSVVIAVPLAVIAAIKRNRLPDQVVRAVPLVGLGFPPFWLGIMLLLIFGLHLGRAFPVGGYGERLHRAPARDVPSCADRRARDLPDPDPQPAREPARGARVRLRDHGALQGHLGAPRASAGTPFGMR